MDYHGDEKYSGIYRYATFYSNQDIDAMAGELQKEFRSTIVSLCIVYININYTDRCKSFHIYLMTAYSISVNVPTVRPLHQGSFHAPSHSNSMKNVL